MLPGAEALVVTAAGADASYEGQCSGDPGTGTLAPVGVQSHPVGVGPAFGTDASRSDRVVTDGDEGRHSQVVRGFVGRAGEDAQVVGVTTEGTGVSAGDVGVTADGLGLSDGDLCRYDTGPRRSSRGPWRSSRGHRRERR
jgi:hypothetical protein